MSLPVLAGIQLAASVEVLTSYLWTQASAKGPIFV